MPNNIFGGNQGYSTSQGFSQNFGGQQYPQNIQPNDIRVYSMNTREGAEQYPVPVGSTAIFMNYNGRKFWIKTQNTNGLSYDLQEMIFFTPEELQNYTEQIKATPQASQATEYATKKEFDELKRQFEEFIK